MAPPKFHEMRFSFAEEDSEEEEFDSEDEPDDGGQGGGQVYTAHFTQKTVNCVNHLGFRVGEIGGNEELYEELEETLWVDYDGTEEEPDPEGGSCFRMLDTRHTPIFWECFDVSLEEAKGAFDESRFSHVRPPRAKGIRSAAGEPERGAGGCYPAERYTAAINKQLGR